MKIHADKLCQCGHRAIEHTCGAFYCRGMEVTVANKTSTLKKVIKYSVGCESCTCKVYQLPNLDLVEYLAKKRGLI